MQFQSQARCLRLCKIVQLWTHNLRFYENIPAVRELKAHEKRPHGTGKNIGTQLRMHGYFSAANWPLF